MTPSANASPALRLPRRRQQVAAVCYRIRKHGIEFLLVQTRGGRWIFPKGGVEPGLTHAQSAALEAFEEAGVHGRMETTAFTRYLRRKPEPAKNGAAKEAAKTDRRSAARDSQPDPAVIAHLCEVVRLEPPQESNRKPTWFSPEKAKQRLFEGRAIEFGEELASVVDRAVARFERQHREISHRDRREKDPLQQVRFEALDDERLRADLMEAVLARHLSGQRRQGRQIAAFRNAVQGQIRKYLQIGAPGGIARPFLRLGSGDATTEIADKITAIDSGRKINPPTGPDSVFRSRITGTRSKK